MATKIITKRISITNRFGENLEALLRKPNAGYKLPAILFVSGLGMNLHEWHNSFDEISRLLVSNGFLTLQFSFAGRGKSDGDYAEMTFGRQGKQIVDVLAWFKIQPAVNPDRIGIIAQSCGVPSLFLADAQTVKTLLFISGEFNPLTNLRRKFIEKKAYNPQGISRYPRSSDQTDPIGPQFWKNLEEFNEVKLAPRLTRPIFIATGDNDTYVYPADAKRVYSHFSNPKKKIKIYPGGDHGLKNPKSVRREFLREVVEWFKSTL